VFVTHLDISMSDIDFFMKVDQSVQHLVQDPFRFSSTSYSQYGAPTKRLSIKRRRTLGCIETTSLDEEREEITSRYPVRLDGFQ